MSQTTHQLPPPPVEEERAAARRLARVARQAQARYSRSGDAKSADHAEAVMNRALDRLLALRAFDLTVERQ